MHVMILGSGTAIPLADRASPGLALFAGEHPVLFDFGPGTVHQLARAGIDHTTVEHIFLTHFHPDHTAGLTHLFFAARNPRILSRRLPFTLFGPSGLVPFIQKLRAAYEGYLDLPSEMLRLVELKPAMNTSVICGNGRVSTCRTDHTANSIAYRIEDDLGKSIVYAGDTAFSEEVIELARGVDLLILEASFPDGSEVPGHLTPSMAGQMASLAGAKHLLLTHFYPECLETDIAAQCRKTYAGELTLARDLLTIQI